MAIDPNIKKKADDIRNKVYGKEVRESLASGLEAMSTDVVETVGRQDEVESQWQNVVDETTGKDVISAPEIIAARNGESNLKARLDKESDEVTAQLAQTISELPQNKDHLIMHNETDSTRPIMDLASFATTNRPIGFVFHNYTDGKVMQLDNVGSNTGLQITNAFNPTNRPDKPNNYVGNGPFIDFQEYQVDRGKNVSLLAVSKDGNLFWSGEKGSAIFQSFKPDDGSFLFEFRNTVAQSELVRFSNGSKYVLSIRNANLVDGNYTQAVLESHISQPNGMAIHSRAGSIDIVSANEKTRVVGGLNVTRDLQLGIVTSENALNNSLFIEQSVLKYKNNAGIVKTVAFTD